MSNFNKTRTASTSNIISLAEYKQSKTILMEWKSLIKTEIDNLEFHDDLPNTVNNDALTNAKLFTELLPLDINPPSLGLEPNGAILLEWYKKSLNGKTIIFSTIIDEEKITWAIFNSGQKSYGTLNFSDEFSKSLSVEVLSPLLQDYFGIKNDSQSKRSRYSV